MRNDFEGLINRINTAKERISEAEFRLKEITQNKNAKNIKKWGMVGPTQQNIQKLSGNI